MVSRNHLWLGTVIPLILLSGCGGDSGVASTPTPLAAPAAAPPPPPPPPVTAINYDTVEYSRSNAAVQAQALSAYQTGATGKGITVAVIDSGINLNSAEFSGKISPLSADLGGSRGLQDEDGHGTAVSGVLLAAKNDVGAHGVAPDATLLVARTDIPGTCTAVTTTNDGCSHNDNNIARGVDLAINAGARAINISLGGAPANANLRAAIGRATSAGIIIVISAGNDGVTNPDNAANPDLLAQIAIDPIAHGLVLIAGATTSRKTLADFSNKAGNGSAYYLTALGVDVFANNQAGVPYIWSGTSFSAPVVSGAVALLAQAFPNLTGAQIVDLLLRTATDLGATGTDAVYGHGELNLAKAFAPQGATSLAGSAVAVSLSNNGSVSAAMGDATQSAMAATISDSYGRAFAVDLSATLSPPPATRVLTPALNDTMRHVSLRGRTTTMALSIADQRPEPLMLDRGGYANARALAGSVATRIGRGTALALGFATGSDGLDNGLSAHTTPAFLVADSARGLDKAPQGAFALRQRLGGLAVTLAAETGDMQVWERQDIDARGDRHRGYGYGAVTLGVDGHAGPLELGARLSRITERETVLGAHFLNALGGGGATSWLAKTNLSVRPASHWRVGGEFVRGWTLVPLGAVRTASTLATQALAFDIQKTSLLTRDDSFDIRWSEPLRVTNGGIRLTGFDLFSLVPEGHERDLEVVYARDVGPGALMINSFWRQQPGNFAAAPDDIGFAVRYSFGF